MSFRWLVVSLGFRSFLLLPVWALAGIACAGDASSIAGLVGEDWASGCFGEKGQPPLFRVDKRGNTYFAIVDGKSYELRVATPQELRELFNDDATDVSDSLIATEGRLGVFKIKSGAQVQDKAADTDFMAVLPFGGGSIYKTLCSG